MAGEFGRTPKITPLTQFYKEPGRDHWGAVQTVFFAGGGVQGGRVVGSSDKIGGFPADDPQTPENMAATIYQASAFRRRPCGTMPWIGRITSITPSRSRDCSRAFSRDAERSADRIRAPLHDC